LSAALSSVRVAAAQQAQHKILVIQGLRRHRDELITSYLGCYDSKCLTALRSSVTLVLRMMKEWPMSVKSRIEALERAGLVHPRADAVTAELFRSDNPFFLAADKVQVKYEMLRAVVVDGATVVSAAEAHGYSRAEFYLVQAAFADRGMAGLVDGRRGRKGPTKVSPDIAAFLRDAPAQRSGAELAREVEARFGVSVHRRTAERIRRR
jgi:hypothetical protein